MISYKPVLLFLTFTFLLVSYQCTKKSIPFKESKECSECHQTIYEEWEKSMHSMSSPHKDMAHKAVYKKFLGAMKKAGKKGNYHCGNCHTPMAGNLQDLISGKAQPDSNNWKEVEGVGCTFCHRIKSIISGKNFNSYKINEDGAYYVSNTSMDAPHKTSKSDLFKDGTVCMGCHSHLINPKGASICVMREEGEGNCLECHMKEVDGVPAIDSKKTTHKSHLMMGGHDLNILKQAVVLDADIEAGEDKSGVLFVKLINKIAHTFPSTNPMRIAFIRIEATDKDGNKIWSNFNKSPMEDKKALFFKAFKGGDKVGVPAWKAESIAFDTRLKTGEKREIEYRLDNKDIKKITVNLIYRLFPPMAIDMLEIPRDGVNDKSYIIAKKEIIL